MTCHHLFESTSAFLSSQTSFGFWLLVMVSVVEKIRRANWQAWKYLLWQHASLTFFSLERSPSLQWQYQSNVFFLSWKEKNWAWSFTVKHMSWRLFINKVSSVMPKALYITPQRNTDLAEHDIAETRQMSFRGRNCTINSENCTD